MDQDQAFHHIAAQRRDLAAVLGTLSPEQWEAPSLCGAWTVRDVTAHLMLGPTTSTLGFAGAMVRARGRFDEANLALTAARAKRPTAELVALLETHAKSRFVPPRHDFHAPLTDLLLHRVDLLAPLGLDRPVESDRTAWDDVLDLLVSPRARLGFVPRGLPALEYVATDVSWRHGEGARVAGPGRALATAVAGRTAYLDQLEGPGAEALSTWARTRSGA